jgi:hypothetical protein
MVASGIGVAEQPEGWVRRGAERQVAFRSAINECLSSIPF